MTEVVEKQAFGEPMEDFELRRLGADETLNLNGLLAGRRGGVVVFWSGVCSHCARYDDRLNRFAEAHPRLALVAVACRQGEDGGQLRAAAAARGLRFPIVLDGDRTVARSWLVRQTPRVFLLDDQRRLIYRGAIDNFKYPRDPEYRPYLDQEVAAFLARLFDVLDSPAR